ncbi:MAG: hypothetical protein RIS92_2769 [Verrucomicrobiota bacterium]
MGGWGENATAGRYWFDGAFCAALSAMIFLMDWSQRFQLVPWSSPTRTLRKPFAVSDMG